MNKQNNKGNAPQIQGGKLAIPGLSDTAIRITSDERFSVYDVIRVVGQQKAPHKVWERLCKHYPEVLTKCQNLKFPGKGQRKTPVITKQGLIELFQVLPGEFGAKFRKETAQIILRYINGDTTLADEVVDRAAAKGKIQDIERHIARSKGIVARKQFTSACKRHGVYGPGYSQVTNAIYHGCFNKSAKDLRKERGLKPKENFRENGAQTSELIAFSAIEIAASNGLDRHDAYGNEECAQLTYKAAKAIAKIMKGEF